MRRARRTAMLGILALTWLAAAVLPVAGQEGAGAVRSVLTPAQMEDFLLHARIDRMEEAGKGVTGTRRATLSDGRITHDASIQTVDVSLARFKPAGGPVEQDFKDTYRYNIAGYRLARLLDLGNVPVSVERRVKGASAAVTWWIDDVQTDENARAKQQSTISPDMRKQVQIMYVFDELIANTDRNGGNVLWTVDGRMWLIDHTRAFRLSTHLRAPQRLERCERGLLDKMRGLTAESLKSAAGDSLNRAEIQAVLARRDAIVRLFEGSIAERGEAAVLFTLPPG